MPVLDDGTDTNPIRYCIKSATMGIHAGAAIILPLGSEVFTAEANLVSSETLEANLIEVEWSGKNGEAVPG